MTRQALSARKVRRIAQQTGLDVVRVLVRGGTDHRRDLFTTDGEHWALYRDGGLEHIGPTREHMPPDDLLALWASLAENGYRVPRMLPSGEVAAIRNMVYTCGLFVGLDLTGYRTRFCYPDAIAALWALMQWDGSGDPPGNWIKEKGRVERANPNIAGIPVKVEP